MIRLLRTELLKQRTTPVMVAGVLAAPVVAALVSIAIGTTAGHGDNAPLGSQSLTDAIGGPASIITALALLLGVLGMAGEYRHQTVTTTFLATPRRRDVVLAKALAHAVTGLVMAVSALVVTLTIMLPWLHSADVSIHIGGDAARVAAGLLLSTAMYGALGVAIGALVRNQTAAAAIVLVWLMAVEGILADVFRGAAVIHWLPVAAGSALVHIHSADLLPFGLAAVVLAGYVMVFTAAAVRFMLTKDVT